MKEERNILIGWIAKPHGTTGKMVVYLFPEAEGLQSIVSGTVVYVGYSERFALPYTVESVVPKRNRILLKLSEINIREEVYQFQEMGVFVPENALLFQLEESSPEYPYSGFVVYDASTGEYFGEVVEMWELPAHDVIVVQSGSRLYPIPFVDAYIQEVDPERKRITVRLIEGFEEIAIEKKSGDGQEMDEN